jgi:hypothetical protein
VIEEKLTEQNTEQVLFLMATAEKMHDCFERQKNLEEHVREGLSQVVTILSHVVKAVLLFSALIILVVALLLVFLRPPKTT